MGHYEVLGVSRSLVSLAISELTDYGLVRATSEARNAPWEATWDVWPTITGHGNKIPQGFERLDYTNFFLRVHASVDPFVLYQF